MILHLSYISTASVQGMCRQLATEEEGSEGEKKTYWYSSFSALNDFSSSHSLFFHHLYRTIVLPYFTPSLPKFYVYVMININ